MDLWLKSLNRYSVSQINTYPTVTNAITILTSLLYGWRSDVFQIRYPIFFLSLTVCFFAKINLAIWDGVPFGLKWASYYLTGFAQGSGTVSCLERKIILGSTNSIAHVFFFIFFFF
ncbi:uncharacterized protein BDW70DRAFT_158438 [Aspergillus foveolatus]|uniref:uncharacterized protein n=1 Tax=Aspergillus foveolatus TaxID=210207 RepID=UPI003CCE0457